MMKPATVLLEFKEATGCRLQWHMVGGQSASRFQDGVCWLVRTKYSFCGLRKHIGAIVDRFCQKYLVQRDVVESQKEEFAIRS